jgi:hypothetical protein
MNFGVCAERGQRADGFAIGARRSHAPTTCGPTVAAIERLQRKDIARQLGAHSTVGASYAAAGPTAVPSPPWRRVRQARGFMPNSARKARVKFERSSNPTS